MPNDNIFSGLKVVDLASFIAGPSAAVILSDFGADVIKVEPPNGDLWRIANHLPPVDLVQHLVPTARIKIEGDVAQAGIAVAANQCMESPQVLPDGVFASGEQIDRQIAADLAEGDRIVQTRRDAEEGSKGVGVRIFKAEGISHERMDNRLIAAQPVERRARRLECGVEEVAARGLLKRGPGQAFKRP